MAAKATAVLDLNITGFDSAIKTAKNLMAGLAATFAAYKIEKFFEEGIKGAIDFGKEMQSASRAMGGFDPGALLLTQKALEKAGMGAEEARGHIGDFIKEGRNVSELFQGADNYAAALKSAAADYGAQASVLSRSAEKLQSVWNTMESIGSKVKTFFLTMTEQFILPLQAALDYLNQIDLAGVGAEFGAAISKAATILIGVFKNGDMMETIKLGLTVAFQEGVNWLVGGINYVAGITQQMLGKAFMFAVSKLHEAWNFVVTDSNQIMLEGFIGVAAKFAAKMMEGINSLISYLSTGLQFAIQTAIEAIPGLSELTGVGGATHEDFTDMAKSNKGPIPQEYIDSIRTSGGQLTEGVGGRFKEFADQLFKGNSENGFKKVDLFDTTESGKKLQELIEKGFAAGVQLENDSRDKHAKDEKGAKQVLNQFSGSSSHVIADSLAKVGGGGGFLVSGQTLAAKSLAVQTRAAKASEETATASKQTAKNTAVGQKPALLPR